MGEVFDFGDGPVPAHRHPNGGGWVADTATVSESAFVGSMAWISGSARVSGSAVVSGSASVSGYARVSGSAVVSGSASVSGYAVVGDSAVVIGCARVSGSAVVSDSAVVSGYAVVGDSAVVIGCAVVSGSAVVSGYARVGDSAVVIGCARISSEGIENYLPVTPVPRVEDIDAAIYAIVSTDEGTLDMADWHSCATTHCRAGWAVHLAGEAGYALEKECGSWLAGALIYQASRPGRPIPNFFASTSEALDDLAISANT